jgi:hypothetical protein
LWAIIKKAKEVKPATAAVDQRYLCVKTSVAHIAAGVENVRRENVKKFHPAHGMMTKMVHTTLHKDLQLSKKLARYLTELR